MSSLFYRGNYVYIRYKDRPGHWVNQPLGIQVEKKEKKNGKWVYPKEAREIQKKIDEDAALGYFGFRREAMNKAPRLSEVAEEYYTKQLLKPATLTSYRQTVANAIRLMGDLPIVQYQDKDVERFRKALQQEGKSKATMAKWLRELSIIFEFARKKRRYTLTNVVEDLKLPPEEGNANPFTAEELKCFFATAWEENRKVYYQAMFLLLTGCRSNESCALKIEDIHLNQDEFTYHNQKGDRADSVPMTEVLREFLSRIPDVHAPYAFAFRSVGGLNRALQRVVKKAGIKREGLTVHSLKKTLGTVAVSSGVNLDIAAMLLHHTDRAVTVDHYLQKEAMKKLKTQGLETAHQALLQQILNGDGKEKARQ